MFIVDENMIGQNVQNKYIKIAQKTMAIFSSKIKIQILIS